MITETFFDDVRLALRTRLLDAVPSLPEGRQWEGLSFSPTPGASWIREYMLRAPMPTERRGPGPSARFTTYGVYQVSLLAPADDPGALRPIELLAARIVAAFPDTLALTHGAQRVRIRSAGAAGATADEMAGVRWSHLPVRIEWSADTYAP